MAIWTYNDVENSYSAVFPTADGRRYSITVSEDEFANDEFKKGDGKFLPLKEGKFYHYEISNGGKLSSTSSFVQQSGSKGRIAPGTSVGYGRLWLEGHTAPEEALDVEVVSEIIGYKDDYNTLLTEITGYVADLQMQCTSDVQYLIGLDEEKTPENLLQQYFFLVGIVNDSVLEQAIRHIVDNPYKKLITVEAEHDIRKATRLSSSMLRQIASSSRRVSSPNQLKDYVPTLPEKLYGVNREETTDVAENRFIKHVLVSFRTGLQKFKDDIKNGKLKANSKKIYSIELDVRAGLDKLDLWLSNDFFRTIGPLTSMPSSSIVLQRREGYRDVLRKWLQSHAASTMNWSASTTIYRENQKDVATLYEYWCFFRLLDVIKDIFNIEEEEVIDKIVGVGTDGLSLKICEGAKLPPLNGHYISSHTSQRYRSLEIEYQYNRRFTNSQLSRSSWSMTMIPDYTISFRPQGMSVEDAERLDLISYVHFDAKYKAKEIFNKMDFSSKCSDDADNGAVDTEDAKFEKDVKRIDILKMHTYRDAIPRTAGAYILYPGTKKCDYRYGEEILPGLGAFPFYPGKGEFDDEPIKEFLSSVAKYLCDRITRWENYTYHKNLVYSSSQEEWGSYQAAVANKFKYSESVNDQFDDKRNNMSDRYRLASIPPERFMSVNLGGEPKDKYSRDKQVRWIFTHNLFIKSIGQKKELSCAPDDLLMITGMWYPPFTMMVKRYCGTKNREELQESFGDVPFPGEKFHIWEISLNNAEKIREYLEKNNLEGISIQEI